MSSESDLDELEISVDEDFPDLNPSEVSSTRMRLRFGSSVDRFKTAGNNLLLGNGSSTPKLEGLAAFSSSEDVRNMSLAEIIAGRQGNNAKQKVGKSPPKSKNMSRVKGQICSKENVSLKKIRGSSGLGGRKGSKNTMSKQKMSVKNAAAYGANNVRGAKQNKHNSSNLKPAAALMKPIKFTPEAGIRMLAEQGFLVVNEVQEMSDCDHPEFYARRWRVIYYDGRDPEGGVRGIGEGPRKGLANQCAALDFIENFQRQRPDLNLPICQVPRGFLIRPSILRQLENLCEYLELESPRYEEDLMVLNGREFYKYTIRIGEMTFWDKSFDLKLAKYKAAKRAHDELIKPRAPFPYDSVIRGSDCIHDGNYAHVHSEELNIVHAKLPGIRKVGDGAVYDFSEHSEPFQLDDMNAPQDETAISSCEATGRRVRVAAVGHYNMSPALMTIRSTVLNRSATPTVNSSDPRTQQQLIMTPLEVPLNSGLEPRLHSPAVSIPSPLPLNWSDVRCRSKLMRQDCVPRLISTDFYPADVIREVWHSQLRPKVLDYMGRWESFSEASETGAEEDLRSFRSPKASRHSMTFSGVGYGNSLNVANSRSRRDLLTNVNTVQNILWPGGSSGFHHPGQPPKRINPFKRLHVTPAK